MSENKFSLIDPRALSEPACKLIDAVSQCIGTLYEPTRIRRKAKAEADAVLMLAEADAERQALLKRAAHRLAIQEVHRQKNIETIIKKGVESLPENVSSKAVDPDWISRFFDECKDVSNEDLQKIWGRILAGEVAEPGSCSRKTLAILKDLSQEDAESFIKFCSYVWVRESSVYLREEDKYNDEYYFMPIDIVDLERFLDKCGMSYNECLHLESLGLIHCKKDISIDLESYQTLIYFNLKHVICENACIRDGWGEIECFLLTQAGIELLSVATVEFNWNYYYDCCKSFKDYHDVYLSCPIEKK
jgi:uncharacterized repeat protein (TIGR03899 family)